MPYDMYLEEDGCIGYAIGGRRGRGPVAEGDSSNCPGSLEYYGGQGQVVMKVEEAEVLATSDAAMQATSASAAERPRLVDAVAVVEPSRHEGAMVMTSRTTTERECDEAFQTSGVGALLRTRGSAYSYTVDELMNLIQDLLG